MFHAGHDDGWGQKHRPVNVKTIKFHGLILLLPDGNGKTYQLSRHPPLPVMRLWDQTHEHEAGLVIHSAKKPILTVFINHGGIGGKRIPRSGIGVQILIQKELRIRPVFISADVE